MRKLNKTFGENLEQFELAKVKRKYERLGYIFKDNLKRTIRGNTFELDAYAKNPETKDEVIFEVKARETVRKDDTEKLVKRRIELKQAFPRARFILVLAQEQVKPEINKSDLNKLLLEYIDLEYIQEFHKLIIRIKLTEVDNINIENIDFNNFISIKVKGIGNLKFQHFISTEDFEGNMLSDGIPFRFDVTLENNFNKKNPFKIGYNSKIKFDLTEFK